MRYFIYVTAFLFAINSIAQPANSRNHQTIENSDKKHILRTLKAETSAFYANDYEAWKAQWAKTENSVVAWNNVDGTYRYMRGWDSINETFKDMIEGAKEEAHPDFNVGNVDIEINGNMAHVVYDEYVANSENKFSKVPGVKTLRKVEGEWKLHSVISFWDRNYQYSKRQVLQLTMNSPFKE